MSTTLNGMSREDTEESGDDCGAEQPPRPPNSRARARGNESLAPVPAGRIATTLARIEEVEDLLAAGTSPRRAAGICAGKWGIGRRQAHAYIEAVHKRWLAEASSEDRETKRARMRAMVMRTYQTAMDRERGITVNVGDWKQEVEYVADPDLRSAGNMLELLCRLDGLLEQARALDAPNSADAMVAAMHAYYFGRQDGAAEAANAQVVEAKALGTGDDDP